MLTPYLPFPDSSGGQIRSYNLIKDLSKKHEITLFSLIKDDSEKQFVSELEKYCKKVEVFKRSKSPWTLRNIFLTGFGPYPFLVIRNLSPKERSAVNDEINKNHYDLIHAETFYVMPHIPKTNIPILLVEQTIEYLVYKHYVQSLSNLFVRLLFSIDVAKLRYWETSFWKKADGVVAVSNADKKEMLNLAPNLSVDLVPNGVNLDFFKAKKSWNEKEPKILFVANFKWLQNAEAAELLLNKVFPLIYKKNPNTKILIVGQYIPENIISKNSKNIIIRNLIENAAKYNKPKGYIYIKTVKYAGNWVMEIKNPTEKVKAKGYGLGITIIKDICHNQNLLLNISKTRGVFRATISGRLK